MNFLNDYFKFDNKLVVNGLTKELNLLYIVKLYEHLNDSVLVVTKNLYDANNIYNGLQTYLDNVLLFPMDDFLTSVIVAESPELKFTRLETLKKIKEGKYVIVMNLMAYLKFLPNKNESLGVKIKVGDTFNRKEFLNKIEEFGYHKESIVTSTGEYAVRGFIVDLFGINEVNPVRFEFNDDEIESIRYFDEETQMSINKVDSFTLSPINEVLRDKTSILDYFKNSNVVFIDYDQIEISYKNLCEDVVSYKEKNNVNEKLMFELNELVPTYSQVINTISSYQSKNSIVYNSQEISNYNLNFEKLKDDIYVYNKKGYKVIFCLSKDSQIKQIKELDVTAKYVKMRLNKGFILDNKYVVISENDLENNNHYTQKYKNTYKFGKKLKNYNQLEIGDYVVHLAHGIGIYNGLVKLSKNGVLKDYIQILYAGNDKIYVPVEKISTIYKYGDKDGAKPNINKLNSTSWAKTKKYVTSKIKDISKELIELYKTRLSITNRPYIAYPEEEVFGSGFQYELTKDQIKSISDILADLQTNHPMDRLLCGDVGFGKTEVALRAMFEAILNNEQVMYLCPTTILSNQQYQVALKRFKEWPIEVALLNRFTTKKEAKRITEGLKNGTIDVVFGTHRLFGDDVELKKLGLLIIDEEQRFGVSHKEKIKKLKTNVNVLTLSATPIPRTLKMALSGIKDLSVIDTAPINRYPVQTYVIKDDDLIVRDALYKELARNGQSFVLFNSVENIENQVYKIRQMVPEARITYAHGQMSKEELENIMADFIDHKFDILVCTTIIESGIDIPNANTLIVYDADRFGLSQLYQIRGRVGRSNKIAYCYLLYSPVKTLNEVAVKRLNAIKEFTELGSGVKVAMRDLSIRGAGDIFGSSQAGFVDSVGIALYTKMIDDELRRQKGEQVDDEEEEDGQTLLNVQTHISDDYVSDEDVKIEIHQIINTVDSYEKFKEVKKELEDRFGSINEDIENYMYEEWFESIAKKLNITRVTQTNREVEIELPEEITNRIKGDKLLVEAYRINPKFNLRYFNKRIFISLPLRNLEESFLVYLVKLLSNLPLNEDKIKNSLQ